MATSTTQTQPLLIRDELWSKQIQEELQEELYAQEIVDLVSDFPDGDLLTIPTFSSLVAEDYTEDTAIDFETPTTGEFQLAIDKYIYQAVAITDKLKQDSFYINEINTKFPEMCTRALLEAFESDIFKIHKNQLPGDNPNRYCGYDHRYVGGLHGGGSVECLTLEDIAYAKLALDKCNVPKTGRKAIVDPTVAYRLVNIDNVIRQDVYGPNSALKTGFGTTKFIGTYLGFDFYESNMVDGTGEWTNAPSDGDLLANYFIGPEAFKGAVRQLPAIEYFRNVTYKRDEYSTTMRYGLGLYRPESLVTVLTGKDVTACN